MDERKMNNNKSMPRNMGVVLMLPLLATSPTLVAGQLAVTGGTALQWHDNGGLTSTNEESDLERIVNADISYQKPDGELTTNLRYQLEYSDFLHDTQRDQTAVNGNAAVVWRILPNTFEAVLNHQISQQQTDRRTVDTTNNRERRSVITAGVDGYLHFSSVDTLTLSPRFTDVKFQDSTDADSQRASMAATLAHRLDELSTLALIGSYDDVSFDISQNDYKASGLVLSYNAALSRLSYQIGLGYNGIDRDSGDDVNGMLVRIGFTYDADDLNWGGSFVRQLTDNSIGLSGVELSLDNFHANDSNFEQFDVVTRTQGDLFVEKQFGLSHQLRLAAGYLNDDYEDTPRDQRGYTGQIYYRYTINSLWSAAAEVNFERIDFVDDPSNLRYDTTRARLSLFYRPTRPLEIQLAVGQEKRDANISSVSYTDNILLVGVQYRFY